MLIDFQSQDNYNQFNIGLARKIGLESAVYINELLKIYSKALRKGKIKEVPNSTNPNEVMNFFKVDRNYIETQTTLTPEKQLLIDKALVDLKLVVKDSADVLYLDNLYLNEMFATENERAVKKMIAVVKPKSTVKDKSEAFKESLKLAVKVEDNEIYTLYAEWIDAVLANPKAGYLTSAQACQFKAEVEKFTNGNRNAYIGVLKTAIYRGYKTAGWVINAYKRDNHIADSVSQLSAPAIDPKSVEPKYELFDDNSPEVISRRIIAEF